MTDFSVRRLGAAVLLLACAGHAAPAAALQLSETLASSAAGGPQAETAPRTLALRFSEQLTAEPAPEKIEAQAMAMLGTHYEFGGTDDDGIDCSALMQKIFKGVGLMLPRTTHELLTSGQAVRHSELRKGDLLFYRWRRRGLHVAVYVDDGYIVHASPAAGRVIVTKLNGNWQERLVAVRRLL